MTGRASPSSRGKRHCRMLKDVAGTQDGRHIVLVCSDGMVLYHRHTQVRCARWGAGKHWGCEKACLPTA